MIRCLWTCCMSYDASAASTRFSGADLALVQHQMSSSYNRLPLISMQSLRIFSRRTMSTLRYLTQQEAINIDLELFNEYRFSVDQLMELAGLSVAAVIESEYKLDQFKRVLICCGPGNNGGDGLVAGRHLKLFGYDPLIVYPKKGRGELFDRLTHQLQGNGIAVVPEIPVDMDSKYDLIVDAVFGFSYKPPLRPEFQKLLSQISKSSKKTVCIDVPSGWDVEHGPPNDGETPILRPDCLISLTAPKLCARLCDISVRHYLAGRFVPGQLDQKYELNVGTLFPRSSCFVCLNEQQ